MIEAVSIETGSFSLLCNLVSAEEAAVSSLVFNGSVRRFSTKEKNKGSKGLNHQSIFTNS